MFQETGKQNLDLSSFSQQMDYNNADTLTDIHDHSPLPSHPSIFMAFSASSKGKDWTTLSPQWNTSLNTPMSQLDEIKNLQELSSHGRVYDILEDGMPDILKVTPNPIAPVKVSPSMASEFPPSPSHALH